MATHQARRAEYAEKRAAAARSEDLNAVDEANYREPNTGAAFRMDQVCGNCAAYNQTDDILECLGLDDDMEEPPIGYCQIYKFVCEAENTCDSWAEGGPMVSETCRKSIGTTFDGCC
jgi:hypothetical protein